MKKICVVITARPSYSRVKTVLEALRVHQGASLQIVLSASAVLERYGNVAQVVEDDGFHINARLYTAVGGAHPISMVKTTGLCMQSLADVFDNLKPSIVVTIADRHETLATAATAAYMNIPLAHIQGGEMTGSIDDKVRNAVTQLADIHCVSTNLAADRVMGMRDQGNNARGVQNRVYVTGCPSIDLAARVLISSAIVTHGIIGGVGPRIDLSKPYQIVMYHPDTTQSGPAFLETRALWRQVMSTGIPALWFWPNIDSGSDDISKALRVMREEHPAAPVHFFRNLDPDTFLHFANRAACIVGNSSFGIREASFLGLPAINIGTRQQGRERAINVIDVLEVDEVGSAIIKHAGHRFDRSALYGDGQAGLSIANILVEAAHAG